jgi:hypothetical protein
MPVSLHGCCTDRGQGREQESLWQEIPAKDLLLTGAVAVPAGTKAD